MNLADRRGLYPCGECGVDAGELCLSKKGERMSRFVHAVRGPEEISYKQWRYFQEWLVQHGDIFRESA